MSQQDSEIARLRAENEQLKRRLQSVSVPESDFHQPPGDFQLCASPTFRLDKHHGNGSVPRSAGSQMAASRFPGPRQNPNAQIHRQPDRSQDSHQPMKRAKTVHVPKTAPIQTSPSNSIKMGRSSSSRSANIKSSPLAPARQGPRPGPGPMAPSLPVRPSRMDHSIPKPMLVDYISQAPTGQPASAFLYDPIDVMPHQGASQPLAPLVESGREYNPDEYLAMLNPYGMMEDMPSNTMPMSISLPCQPPDFSSMHANPAYSNSGLPSLSSTPTLETPMSRQGSQAYPDLAANLDMVRIQSQQSSRGQDYLGQSNHITPEPMFPKGSDTELMAMGSNLMDPRYHPASFDPRQQYNGTAMGKSDSQRSTLSTSSIDWDTVRKESILSTDMERSESTQSGKSLKLRAQEALQRQNANAKAARALQPKPIPTIKKEPSESHAAKVKEGKAPITKTSSYQRPKHPKVYCNQCQDVPEGFRGEHELRRHTQAKHKSVVKKWICVEPAVETPIKAFKSLADCKQCTAQKQYGAYYNAAAHLRRTHFKQKPNRKSNKAHGNSKNKGAAPDVGNVGGNVPADEKRGGKGGGDWPPMPVLNKHWMKVIWVPMESPGAFDGSDEMRTDEPNDMDDMGDLSDFDPRLSNAFADQTGYDMSVSSIDGSYAGMQVAGFGAMDPAMFLASQGAGFDLGVVGVHGLPMGDEYTSPVSSTETITPAMNGTYHEQHLMPSLNMASAGDLPDMSFEMAFQMSQA